MSGYGIELNGWLANERDLFDAIKAYHRSTPEILNLSPLGNKLKLLNKPN